MGLYINVIAITTKKAAALVACASAMLAASIATKVMTDKQNKKA